MYAASKLRRESRTRGVGGPRRGRRERTGAGPGGGRDLRGDDQASPARDRQTPARAIRPQLGTPRAPDRSDGVAARGTRGRGHRGRDHGDQAGEDHDRRGIRTSPFGSQALPRVSAAGAGGDRSSHGLHMLRLGPHREDGRGHHRDARGHPAAVEGDPRPSARSSPAGSASRSARRRRLSTSRPVAGPDRSCWL
jgi:hypothetical protein